MDVHGWGTWDASWLWSMPLIGGTIAFHAAGSFIILRGSQLFWSAPFRQRLGSNARAAVGIVAFVAIALSLAALHGCEALVWAATYLHLHAIHAPGDAVYFSLDSMTTRGASDIHLEPGWRMLGALESMDGMLSFGISTAILFAVMQRLIRPEQAGAKDA